MIYKIIFTILLFPTICFGDEPRFLTPPKHHYKGDTEQVFTRDGLKQLFYFPYSADQKQELKNKIFEVQERDFRKWLLILNRKIPEEFEGEMFYLEGRWIAYLSVYVLIDSLEEN